LNRTKVVLADDRTAFRAAVSLFLAPRFHVVKAVSDGAAVLEVVAKLDPDLVILDISMPVLSGIEAARKLQASGTRAKIVFLTMHRDPDYVQAALDAGGKAYVIKSRLKSDLLLALDEVLADRSFVSPLG
jgi:DNA-binding NarL/FixJ family response regulator